MNQEEKKEKAFELRNETGCGLMDCKKALERNEYDMEKAKAYLRNNAWKHKLLVNVTNDPNKQK
jgi:translation elongation factor EF-Ts